MKSIMFLFISRLSHHRTHALEDIKLRTIQKQPFANQRIKKRHNISYSKTTQKQFKSDLYHFGFPIKE